VNGTEQKQVKHGIWATIWAVWLVIVAVSFAVLETIALVRKADGDTLSENTRTWIGVRRGWKSAGVLGFMAVLVGFVIWFIPHIVWGVW
jgi:hypothetical protein